MITIKGTTQEAYEKIRAHFAKPGAKLAKSLDQRGQPTCYFRHPEDGRPCAVGVLISDKDYCPELENIGAIHALVSLGHIDTGEVDLNFLWRAQCEHDAAVDAEDFLQRLNKVAEASAESIITQWAGEGGQ